MSSLKLQLVLAVVIGLLAATGSWYVTASIKDAEIARIQFSQLKTAKEDAEKALGQFIDSAKIVNEAAKQAHVDVTAVNKQLDQIYKGMKNAKPKPLPPDCAPDPVRVRGLKESIEATNRAITRRESGETVY